MKSIREKSLTLRDLSHDFDSWPVLWKGTERDLAYGRRLLPYFEGFLNELIASGLARTTLRRYVDDAGLLGRSIVTEVSRNGEYAKNPLKKLRESVVNGGMLPEGIDSEDRMRAFERMCRRFEEFLRLSSTTAGAGKDSLCRE